MGNTDRNKADRLFSLQIRAFGECEAAGHKFDCSTKLECCHIISRRYAWTRTYEPNAVCMCSAHHRWFTANPVEWGKWVLDNRGEDVYEDILRRSQRREKFEWASELARLEEK